MTVRLAFAVAAHLEPEILLVDEVLAVGDVGFQRKCIGKMSAVASEGRTVVFVSHNMAIIQSLCRRGIILLERGGVAVDAPIGEAVSAYLRAVESEARPRTHEAAADGPLFHRGRRPLGSEVLVGAARDCGMDADEVRSGSRPTRTSRRWRRKPRRRRTPASTGALLHFRRCSGSFRGPSTGVPGERNGACDCQAARNGLGRRGGLAPPGLLRGQLCCSRHGRGLTLRCRPVGFDAGTRLTAERDRAQPHCMIDNTYYFTASCGSN